MANNNILTEVPPISKQDSFVVFERRKSNFNFPIHIHSECELNYIIGARGARRIVGDHVADIGDREMVLITGTIWNMRGWTATWPRERKSTR